MNGIRVFFDTNVLVYAHDESSRFNSEAALLLRLVLEENQVQGVIAEQNLVELYRILTNAVAMTGKPLTPSSAIVMIQDTYFKGNFEIFYPTSSTLNKTLELAIAKEAKSAKIFDIRLASLVLEAKVDYLATYNLNDFNSIDGLCPLTPNEILATIAMP